MSKKLIVTIMILITMVFMNDYAPAATGDKNAPLYFFVGTYTDAGSQGIYNFSLDPLTGKLTDHGLAAKSNNPSFLAQTPDGKFLLAVHEIRGDNEDTGSIESFSVKKDALQLTSLSRVSSGGAHPCYVSVNQHGYVLAANYTGGNVGLLRLDASGKLNEASDVKQHVGSGPNKARQAEPHVHSAFFEPGSDRVFVADLGIDQVSVYTIDKDNKLKETAASPIRLSPGSGPRHLAFHPKLKVMYVVNELSSDVSVIKLNKDGSFKIVETVSALPPGYTKPNTCADIHISNDGKFLYASNRGLNSIAIFSVDPETGNIIQIGQEPTRGESPRNFTLSPQNDYLLVANQTTQDIVAFRRDATTGKLRFTDQVKALKPVCLLFRK